MKKGARTSAFRNEGIDVFADKSHQSLKDPIQLIKESLQATGGDLEKMNKLFMDVVVVRIDVTTRLGAALLGRKISERHRRLGSAGLTDWSGAVTFPELDQRRTKRRHRRAC